MGIESAYATRSTTSDAYRIILPRDEMHKLEQALVEEKLVMKMVKLPKAKEPGGNNSSRGNINQNKE